MLYMFKHKTERFALEKDYYRTIIFSAQYALVQISGCSCVVLEAWGGAWNTSSIRWSATSWKSAALLTAVGKLKLQPECFSYGSKTTLGFSQCFL